MTCDKAKESFSELHEQTLAGGLRQVVERHLSECPACQEEFRSFKTIYEAMGYLPEVSVPSDLSERIRRRIDNGALDGKLSPGPALLWFRRVGYATAAAAVLLGFFVAYDRFSGGAAADITGGLARARPDPVRVGLVAGQVRLQFRPAERTAVTVREEGTDFSSLPPPDAVVSRTDDLEALQGYNVPLDLKNGRTAVVWVSVAGKPGVTAVFIPGSRRAENGSFKGNVAQALKVISERFQTVIEARLSHPGAVMERDLEGLTLGQALDRVLEGARLGWELSGGVVRVR